MFSTTRARLLVGAVLAVSVAAGATAWGDEGSRRDADERGSNMELDVRRISHAHKKRHGTRLLTHTVRFDERVRSSDLYQGHGGLQLLFDVDGDPDADRGVRFFLNKDGSPYAAMLKGGPKVVGFANWWRPDGRTVVVEIPRRLLGPNVGTYRWLALTAQSAPCQPPEPDGPQADGCTDATKWLRHER